MTVKKIIRNSEKSLKFWLPPVLWALVIFAFSSFKVGQATEVYWKDFIIKKSAHFIEYGIFASLLFRAMINSEVSKPRAMIYSVVIAFLYGVTDEYHQSFTPGREPRIRDIIIDTIGAGFFVYVLIANIQRFPAKIKKLARELNLY